MKIDNRSRVSTAQIRKLLAFVTEHTRFSLLAKLQILDQTDPLVMTEGYARKFDLQDEPFTFDGTAGVVKLWVSNRSHYPVRTSRHVPEVSAVVLSSFEEELLLVLAHELRHVDQFWQTRGFTDAHSAEVDAETFAVSLLRRYRRQVSA